MHLLLSGRTKKWISGIFSIGGILSVAVIATGVCSRKTVMDITEVQSFVYTPVEETTLYSATLDEYMSRNPIYLSDIVEQRQQDYIDELEYKEAERLEFASIVDEYNKEVEAEKQRQRAKAQRVQSELRREYKVYDDKFYIPNIKLEYASEQINFDYQHQAYLYSLCKELDLDYYLMMGVIARESRFTFVTGGTYVGYMGIGASCETFVRNETGNQSLSRYNEYDNMYIGCYTHAYYLNQIGNEDGAMLAYNLGYQGYLNSVSRGIYTNSNTRKAWKFRDLILKCEREYPPKTGD